jgi:hypothetical protein
LLTYFYAFDSLGVPGPLGGSESDFETLKMSSGDAPKSIGRATGRYKINNKLSNKYKGYMAFCSHTLASLHVRWMCAPMQG